MTGIWGHERSTDNHGEDQEPGLGCAPERLESEICELAAHISAATCRWLVMVAEFNRREGWADWGCRPCAHWLNWRCGLAMRAGREHVRVARSAAGS